MPPDDSRTGFPQAFAAGTHIAPITREESSDTPFERFPEEFEPAPNLAERNRSATPMRRDFNLIRLILVEAEQPGKHLFRYDQFNRHMVQNHLFMLIEAGLLEGSVVRDANGLVHVEVERLTWDGHDLLAQVRDPARWKNAQAEVLDANGRAHLSTLLQYLSKQ